MEISRGQRPRKTAINNTTPAGVVEPAATRLLETSACGSARPWSLDLGLKPLDSQFNMSKNNRPHPRWDAGARPMAWAASHTQYIYLPENRKNYFHFFVAWRFPRRAG